MLGWQNLALVGLVTGIFVSYRRDDTLGVAGRICEHLCKQLPHTRVFFDMDAMVPGLDFIEQIESELAKCDVLLALIGKRWLKPADNTASRLENDQDLVRKELRAALDRGIPVVPILIDGASMPSESVLPHDIRAFAKRQALELRNSRFVSDIDLVVRFVRGLTNRRSVARPQLVYAGGAAGLLATVVAAWAAFGSGSITAASEGPSPALQLSTSVTPIGAFASKDASSCERELNSAVESRPIRFVSGSSEFDPDSRTVLEQVAKIASQCERVMIEVQGHTDPAGTSDVNYILTRQRAQAVVRYIVEEAGVPAERLRAVGYGDSRPLAPPAKPSDSRRIQFAVTDVQPQLSNQ